MKWVAGVISSRRIPEDGKDKRTEKGLLADRSVKWGKGEIFFSKHIHLQVVGSPRFI